MSAKFEEDFQWCDCGLHIYVDLQSGWHDVALGLPHAGRRWRDTSDVNPTSRAPGSRTVILSSVINLTCTITDVKSLPITIKVSQLFKKSARARIISVIIYLQDSYF